MAKVVIDLNSDVIIDPPNADTGDPGTKVKLKDHLGAMKMRAKRALWQARVEGTITEDQYNQVHAEIMIAKNWGQLKKLVSNYAGS